MPDEGAAGYWTTWRLRRQEVMGRPETVAQYALRTKSPLALDALALEASRGRHGSDSLLQRVLGEEGHPGSVSPALHHPLAAVALAWAGAGRSAEEMRGAALLFERLWEAGAGADLLPVHHHVAGQALLLAGRTEQLRALLPRLDKAPDVVRHYLATDLANPYRDGRHDADASPRPAWEELLSASFVKHGLSPLEVDSALPADAPVFDRLHAEATPGDPSGTIGDLVTVVMPCYRPDEGLLTSARSIAAQTYSDLEIIVVDDASGPDYADLFAAVEALDPRIRLVRMADNGGSYLAREAAIAGSRGSLITFQDADDWSHPRRIEDQVALLRRRRGAPASRSHAVRAKDDLTHQWLGYQAIRPNASSLMIRRSAYDAVGPFLAVRKGADSEYTDRLRAVVGAIVDTRTPLAVTRLRSGSLSRGDFTFQWATPDRHTFRGAFAAWHRTLSTESRPAAGRPAGRALDPPFPVPTTFVRDLPGADRLAAPLEVAYLADFSSVAGSSNVDGLREKLTGRPAVTPTGLWHLETPVPTSATRTLMADDWYDLIQRQHLVRPLSRVEPVRVRRLVVLSPDVLSTAGAQDCRLDVEEVEVWLTPQHLEPDASLLPVDLLAVSDLCLAWFGSRPRWVASPFVGERQRQRLRQGAAGLNLTDARGA